MRLTPKTLFRFVAPKQGRPMAYPYTWTAKWSKWDVGYEFRTNWTFRYTLYGMAFVFPFIVYLDMLTNSPAARAAHKKAKQVEAEREHEAHMWVDISGRYAKR